MKVSETVTGSYSTLVCIIGVHKSFSLEEHLDHESQIHVDTKLDKY